MRKQDRRRHDAHVRVYNVSTDHKDVFDANKGGQENRAALGVQVADVDRLFAMLQRFREDQRAATEQRRRSREAMADAVRAVIQIARVVHLDDTIMETIRLPDAPNDEELLTYAKALLDRVSPHADAFAAAGLPAGVLERLSDAIQAFGPARDAHAAAGQRFTAAAQSIHDALDKADEAVRVLDVIAANTPTASREILTKLRIAKRVGPRAAAPAKPETTPATSTTPPAHAATPPVGPAATAPPTPASAPADEAA